MGSIKYCPNCGQPIGEGERFCRNCGAPLPSNNGSERSETEGKQWTDQTQNNTQMNSETTATEGRSQNSDNRKALYIVIFILCIILALVIGIFIGRSMGNESETTDTEEIEEPAEESETVEEIPETAEEQSEEANEEAEKEQQNTDVTYSWSVNDGLELTTLEVVSGSEDSTLHATFTNNTEESIVIGWASTAQMTITDVNGNEYFAHVPMHVEIYASESTKLDLEASGKIDAQIAEIKIENVNYIGSDGLPSNIGGSTVTYTVDN